ncbi:EpsG family protein [Pontibacter liquoris]|uniref:EpsG family protein n=1 Tax=Pontibacter liquoris TaxID=2905677 RepID=UPI001FA79E52|nr:EpsG family protein [Pontibacter liquoris]
MIQGDQYLLRNRNKIYIYLIYILSPLLALLVAIKNYRATWAKNVVWLFVAFYGYTMVISNEGIDSSRYRDQFLQIAQSELSFDNFVSQLYNENTTYVDIAQPLISYVVALFTTNYKILFLVYGLIFGFFYSRNIWYIISKAGPKINKETVLFIFVFAFVIGFWQINGFRMWTAAHIFFYGAVRYIFDKKRKGFLIAALSVLVHFSFVLPVFVLILYTFIRNRTNLYFLLFLATFFISEVNFGFLNETLKNIVPDIFSSKLSGYTNEEYVSQLKGSIQNTSWHAKYYIYALKWVIVTFICIMYFRGFTYIKTQANLHALYAFSLLFLAFSNIMSLMPSGGRFVTVANLFATTAIFFFLQSMGKEGFYKKFLKLSVVPLLFYCVVALRLGFDTIGAVTLLGNPIISLIVDSDIAIIDIIK